MVEKWGMEMDELIIGSHVSFTKDSQLLGSVQEALSYGANTFMFYTGAPQNTRRAAINETCTEEGHKALEEAGIQLENIIVHAPYIINLANPDHAEFSVRFLKEELDRAQKLGMTKLVLHPGSHVGQGDSKGIENIIKALNEVLSEDTRVTICLETMAGKGTECGKTFEQIKTIIDGVIYKNKLAVCLDTCHISDAGYDLQDVDGVIREFDKVLGLSRLACIHINDSKNVSGSHKDRHENIGFGEIGFEPLVNLIYHPKLKGIPKILETPYVTKEDATKDKVYPPYKFEIAMIRKKEWNPKLIEDIRSFYK